MRPIPKEIKEMQGTFEPSKEGLEPVEYDVYERAPICPDGWPPRIQRLWGDRCNDLRKSGYLVKAFMVPLRRYCFAVLQAEEAEKQLLENGYIEEIITEKGSYEKPSDWIKILDNANKTILAFGAKFGFSPLDIQKIPVVEKPKETMSLLK